MLFRSHLERIGAYDAEADKAWRDYTATSMSVKERRLADAAGQAQQELVAARDQVIGALKSDGRAAAIALDKRVQCTAKFEQWRESVDKLIGYRASALE